MFEIGKSALNPDDLFAYVVDHATAEETTLIRGTAVLSAQLLAFGIVWVGRYLMLDRWLFKLVPSLPMRSGPLKRKGATAFGAQVGPRPPHRCRRRKRSAPSEHIAPLVQVDTVAGLGSGAEMPRGLRVRGWSAACQRR